MFNLILKAFRPSLADIEIDRLRLELQNANARFLAYERQNFSLEDEIHRLQEKLLDQREGIEALLDASWQVLDDMGKEGTCVCLGAKAQLRIAIDPWIDCDDLDWTLAEANKVWDNMKGS